MDHQPHVVTCASVDSVNQRSQDTPLGFGILLEELTELRKTAPSLAHQFMIKGCNSGTARWKQCTGLQMSHARFRCVTAQHLHVCANLETLQPFALGFLWRFPYAGMIY